MREGGTARDKSLCQKEQLNHVGIECLSQNEQTEQTLGGGEIS